jgi:flagellar basal-body rod protein FlgB
MFFTDASLQPIMQNFSAISERQRLSSANIANAHTPGYTARSASFSDLLKANNPFETDLSRKMGSKVSEINNNTGLPVDLHKELIEMQKNMLFYTMETRRATTLFTGLKSAAQVGR